MSQFINNIQYKIKTSSKDILLFGFKLGTGLFVALTLALIFQVMIGFGSLSFVFVLMTLTLAFLKIAKGWTAIHTMIFNLVCVMMGLLVRMYIMIAPGA